VLTLCLVQLVDVLGVTVVITALPSMLDDLGAPASAGSLVATGYAMCFGGLLMFGARLGDRIGHRRAILIGLAVFGGGAALAAGAWSVPVLTAGRCVQGAGAAVSVPAALRLLTSITEPGEQRRRAVALWSAAGALAGAAGFVVGGLATRLAGWRWAFGFFLPVAVLLALTVLAAVPRDRERDHRRRIEPLGSVLLTAAVMLLVVATTLLPERGRAPLGVVLLAASAALALAFVAVDRRATSPLLPPRLVRQRPLAEGTAASAVNTATTSSAITLATLFLQGTLGRDPMTAGLMMLPLSAAVVVGAALASPALARLAPEHVVGSGVLLIAVGVAGLAVAAASVWGLTVCIVLAGCGLGASSVAANGLGTSVALEDRATASGVLNTAAQLGSAVGIATLLLVADVTTGAPAPGVPAPRIAWAAAAGVALVAAVLFFVRGQAGRRSSTVSTRSATESTISLGR